MAARGDGGFADRRPRRRGTLPPSPQSPSPARATGKNRADGARGAGVELGWIGRPHGVHGEVSVTLNTNRPERTTPGAVLYAGDRELVVEGARPHRGRWLVRFEGVTDRDAAEALRGARLVGEALDGPGEGQVWVHELVGAEARDTHGKALGRVTAVVVNPAHDLLVLEGDVLVPIVFVVERRPGVVVVDVPDGLLDVNR